MNDVDLRTYVERIFDEREKLLDERWEAQKAALGKATTELNERLMLLNELRGNVLSRMEYEAKHEGIVQQFIRLRELHDNDVANLRAELSQLTGQRRGSLNTVTVLISVCAMVFAAIGAIAFLVYVLH